MLTWMCRPLRYKVRGYSLAIFRLQPSVTKLSQTYLIWLAPLGASFDEGLAMKRTNRFALAALATLAALSSLISEGRAEEVVSSYVTFYGFDDNDDGNPTHLGTDVISHAAIHGSAEEDLGTYKRPGTLATDPNFLTPACPH